MITQKTSTLYNQKRSVEFYEARYEQGYMDEWPIEKIRRIFEIINALQLPANGEALDFGCGNGVLTDVIRQALPSWKIYGTDISKRAIENASLRYPECIFFEKDNSSFRTKRFDFVFTNHVFEHVFNLTEVFTEMNEYLKPKSSMLHFLPCGNEGSYEYNLCKLRINGINNQLENRFFFEDEGHVRRLTTLDFCNLCETKKFYLHKEFYSNQYYGSIEWITSSSLKFVLMLSDTSQAINIQAKKSLSKTRAYLIAITILRLPTRLAKNLIKRDNKQIKHYMLLFVILPFLVFSKLYDAYWRRNARKEWEVRKLEKNGSEMCLYFKRDQ